MPSLYFRKAIESADVVIGSRYTTGGKVSNWNWIRRMISKMGNFYARSVLSTPVRDMTTGFRCYRRKVLEAIDIEALSSSGYVVLVELAYKSYAHGFRITEIPITFTERAAGKSKFNIKIFFEAYMQIARLRGRDKFDSRVDSKL
jgi:dolichol-phosphate mannosyltransferase